MGGVVGNVMHQIRQQGRVVIRVRPLPIHAPARVIPERPFHALQVIATQCCDCGGRVNGTAILDVAQSSIVTVLPSRLKRVNVALHIALRHWQHQHVVHHVVLFVSVAHVPRLSVTRRMLFANQREFLRGQVSNEFLVIRPMNGVFSGRGCVYDGFGGPHCGAIRLHEGGNAGGANVERGEMRHEVVAQHEAHEYVVHRGTVGSPHPSLVGDAC